MAALVKYADSDSTKDPETDDDEAGKGRKNSNSKQQQYKPAGHGNGGKRKADGSMDFVANTIAQDGRSGAEVKRQIVMGLPILTQAV